MTNNCYLIPDRPDHNKRKQPPEDGRKARGGKCIAFHDMLTAAWNKAHPAWLASQKPLVPVMGVEPITSVTKRPHAYRCAIRVNGTHHTSSWFGIKAAVKG